MNKQIKVVSEEEKHIEAIINMAKGELNPIEKQICKQLALNSLKKKAVETTVEEFEERFLSITK